jgi:hypothetical protein
MASQLKQQAAEALADFLRPYVHAVTGTTSTPVTATQADYEDEAGHPSVVVLPRRMKFMQWQDDELDESVPDKLLVNVGEFEGTAEIRIVGLGKYERGLVEQAVLDALLSGDVPGTTVLQAAPVKVGATQYEHEPLIAYTLDEEDWREELVFENERYSFLTLGLNYEAFASRDVWILDQIVLAFTEDLDSAPSTLVTEDTTLS